MRSEPSVPHTARHRRAGRWMAAFVVTTAMMAGIGWLARAPWQPHGSTDALLRMSWRLRPPVLETCRARTQAELDALPVHMRTPEICEQQGGAYRLVLHVDSQRPDTTRVLRGGAKGDRPLFVLRDVPLAAGLHHVRVRFEPEDAVVSDSTASPLVLDTVLDVQPGAIALVTLDNDGRTMLVRQSTQQK